MDAPRPAAPSFARALRFWAWLGCISFGGPAGQIAVMHREIVDRLRWVSERRFLHALNYCMVLPGPEAQQLATYLGWLLHGWRGGLAAGLLFVLPSLGLMIGLSWLYLLGQQQPLLVAALHAVRPAVVAIVFHSAFRLARRTWRGRLAPAIALAAVLALAAGWPFPLILLLAALAGLLGGAAPVDAHAARASADAHHLRAVIDDDDAPSSARPRLGRLLLQLLAGVGLAGAVWLAIRRLAGPGGTLEAMALLFGKAALVTFGGAYAVLPYVFQAAVDQQHWLDARQMIDGLALGESTPGPLIIVLAYVGFLGGWQQQALGPDALFAGGLAGALVAAFFTFLPSFVFILAGAPWIEASRRLTVLTRPLAAVSSAVVGVIVHLGWLLARSVCWPDGAGVDLPALLMTGAALLLLASGRIGVPGLVALAASLGVAVRIVMPAAA